MAAPASPPGPATRGSGAGRARTAARPTLLDRLIEPSPSLGSTVDRRRARILAGAMLVIGGLGLAASLLGPLVVGGGLLTNAGTRHGAFSSVLGLAAYGLARTTFWRHGAVLGVTATLYGTWASILLPTSDIESIATVFFLALPLVLAGALLDRHTTFGIGAVNVLAVLVVPGLFPADPAVGRAIAAIFLALVTTLVVVLASIWRGDLAEIDQHRQHLVEREAHLDAILHNTPHYILLVDADHMIRYINQILPGLRRDEVEGSRFGRWFADPERVRIEAAIDTALAGTASADVEVQGPGPHGTTAWWLMRAVPIGTANGARRALIVSQDITERKEAEAARLASAAHRVEVEQLRHLSAFKTSFINMAAHELSTPMTPVTLSARLLRASLDDPEKAHKHLDALQRNVERLRRLLEDVLEAARMQSHHISYRPEPTDLRAVARTLLESYQPTAEAKSIQLVDDMPDGPVVVHADPARMNQVIGNLLDNAIKYSPAGARVTLVIRAEDDGGTIEVRDTGIGLTAAQQERLFQPFERVHERTPGEPPGTGLGLYLVKGIVDRHGGTIECESAGPGTGTTFRIRMPTDPPAEATPHDDAGHPDDPTRTPHAGARPSDDSDGPGAGA